MVQILLARDRTSSRWRNGLGRTWQIASWPPESGLDTFDWRISIAEIASDAQFSSFPDVQRTIAVIDGPGMELDVDGVRHELGRYEPFQFSGSATTSCRLLGGVTRDLNVMTAAPRPPGSIEFVGIGEAETLLDAECLVVVAGTAFVDSVELARYDAALPDGAVTVRGSQTAVVAVIRTG